MNYLKVKDNENLIRDVSTNAIINTDNDQYLNYINERNKKLNENRKIQDLEKELFDLKNDINEIKSLLRNLANGSW